MPGEVCQQFFSTFSPVCLLQAPPTHLPQALNRGDLGLGRFEVGRISLAWKVTLAVEQSQAESQPRFGRALRTAGRPCGLGGGRGRPRPRASAPRPQWGGATPGRWRRAGGGLGLRGGARVACHTVPALGDCRRFFGPRLEPR